jgi:hypothetical protein
LKLQFSYRKYNRRGLRCQVKSLYWNHIMFAKDLSNKIFSPPRHDV